MSMKLQARLIDKLSSHIESKYMEMEDVVRLEGIKAEMTFEAAQGFMAHESEEHEYLPYFHLIGRIKEVHGDFPFNVSTLYFRDADAQSMIQDILYYPTPEELAHIIQTGQYYSKNFTIPPILGQNTYTLPCLLDLTVVPPPNPAAYENNMFNNFGDLEDEEKVNLPIFYVGVLGTGVNRRNDRLLDYYGIDLAPGYKTFLLTAESSGYVDPPLMQYMTAPVVEEQVQRQDTAEYYITPEEESELLHSAAEQQQRAEQKAAEQVSLDVQADYHEASPEDAIIAQADRTIIHRMEKRFDGKRMSLEALREHDKSQQVQAENAGSEVDAEDKKNKPDTPQDMTGVRTTVTTVPETPAQQTAAQERRQAEQQAQELDLSDLLEDDQDLRMQEGGDVEDAAAQTKVDEAHAKDIALDAARQQQQDMAEKNKPEENQQAKMPEAERASDSKQDEHDTVPQDRTSQEHMAGGDVADARDQEKINDAHQRDMARDAARQQQEQAHRQVPEHLQELADKSGAGPKSDDPEYI